MSDQPHILLVEDDVNLGYLLVENIKSKQLDVTLAQNGKAALEQIEKNLFHLCLLDIMLPEMDGFSLAKKIKAKFPELPFIFLTARGQEKDKLRGFDIGADDYVTKPFSFKELYYRMLVVLKRSYAINHSHNAEILSLGNLQLNSSKRILSIHGKEKKLSQREAELLTILLRFKDNYVSRSEILNRLWGRDDYFTGKSMDVFITRLRKLIKDEPALEIENLYGSGYRIRIKNSD
jgi:DNA-binding response OmpR family regulator